MGLRAGGRSGLKLLVPCDHHPIADIDTRRLTRILREKGAQSGCLMAGTVDQVQALEVARGFPGLKGMDLAKEVSTAMPYEWAQGTWTLDGGMPGASSSSKRNRRARLAHIAQSSWASLSLRLK